MSAQPKLSFSDTDKLMQMSLILKAIDDCNQELSEYKANHKARLESLHGELAKLRWEVLSGQERLPLEPIPSSGIVPVMEKVAEMVNSGALDTPGATCTAEFNPGSESSVEEIRRTRKAKPKMQGQDAILPGQPGTD